MAGCALIQPGMQTPHPAENAHQEACNAVTCPREEVAQTLSVTGHLQGGPDRVDKDLCVQPPNPPRFPGQC